MIFTPLKFGKLILEPTFAVPKREHSSAGSEHLPYKQRVGGSNPSAPTLKIKGLSLKNEVALFYLHKIGTDFSVLGLSFTESSISKDFDKHFIQGGWNKIHTWHKGQTEGILPHSHLSLYLTFLLRLLTILEPEVNSVSN